MRLGRAQDAARAFSNAIRVLGDNSEREGELGTALVYASGGQVSDQARKAFESALRLDPHAIGPRFYLGLAAQQVGDKARAVKIWTELLAQAPPDAPWAEMVRERVAALGGAGAPPTSTAAAHIASLPADQRAAAIHGMVDNLAARLAKNGGDVESWLRLVRAYSVLHEADKAREALADARRNLTSDGAALAKLDALARQLGLES
jgi:cytochrome c-type biogenesis protein CcmH